MRDELIVQLAARFCAAPLPETVCADLVAIKSMPGRTGTNLLTLDQAREVLDFVLAETILAGVDLAAPAEGAVNPREQGLTVEIEDGRLVIGIGIDALMTAVQGSPTWDEQLEDERGWSIASADGFAEDIRHELGDEEEDGTTLLHVALDAAIERAIDGGSLNIDFGKDA